MGAKFSDLPQREETAAQEFEIGTLAGYSERLAHIGGEFVARGRGRRLHWARRRAPVFDSGICGNGGRHTPLIQRGLQCKKAGSHVKCGTQLLPWHTVFSAGGDVKGTTKKAEALELFVYPNFARMTPALAAHRVGIGIRATCSHLPRSSPRS